MGITTRSGYSTEPTDPTPPADNGDLWAFVNHPERWQETFYTTFVDSDEEEDEMIGQENSTVADEDDESESIANAMEMDDELKDSDGAVGRHEMGELGWDYMERDGYALFKGKELDDRNEDPMDDDDEADGDISDHVSDTIDEEFDAAFVEDVETQEDGIHSNSTDYGSDAGETDNEGADSPQSDDKAQIENLDPSNNHHLPYDCCYSLRETRSRLVGKEKGKSKYTCSHCGESGHSRRVCKKLHLRPKYTCTRCKKRGHSKNTCSVENPGTSVGQINSLCTHCGNKGHGRQSCQELYLPPKYTCPRCGEKGHSRAICLKKNPGYIGKVIARKKPTCSHCGEYGHGRTGCRRLHLPPKFFCPRCGEKGHTHKRCPKIGEHRKYAYGCSKCGEDGHNSNNCPNVEKQRRQRCTYCNEEGHLRKTCPSRLCIHCEGTDHRPHTCPLHKQARDRKHAEDIERQSFRMRAKRE